MGGTFSPYGVDPNAGGFGRAPGQDFSGSDFGNFLSQWASKLNQAPPPPIGDPTLAQAPAVPLPRIMASPVKSGAPVSFETAGDFLPHDTSSYDYPDTKVGRRIQQGSAGSPGSHATADEREPLGYEWGKDVELGENGRPAEDTTVGASSVHLPVQAHESTGGGGFSPSQTDWSKVGNPEAFEAYRNLPIEAKRDADIARSKALASDPWAEERMKAGIDTGAKLATYEGERRIDQARDTSRVQGYEDLATRENNLVQRLRGTQEFQASPKQKQDEAIAEIRSKFDAMRDARDRGFGKITVKGGGGQF